MPWKHAVSVQVHWWEDVKAPGNVSEAIVEVQFPNQQRQFLTVQILRVSDTFIDPNQLQADSLYRKVAEDDLKKNEVKSEVVDRPPGYRG